MPVKILTIIFLALPVIFADDNVNCPKIVKWKRNAPNTDANYLILPIPYVIIHHTVTSECSTKSQCVSVLENIYSYHVNDLGWSDIGYSFLIGGDGNVYEGCGWEQEGAHTLGYNKKSIAIAFVGNFQDKAANDTMLQAAHKLILCGKAQGILRDNVRVIGARQVITTASPGFELYEQIQNWPEWVSNP